MKLVEQYNPILSQKCDPFDFNNPIMDPYKLAEELHNLRFKGRGVGLAAPQVGINTRALVMGMGDFKTEEAKDFNSVFFNPEITEFSDETVLMIEGCLSYPGLYIKIKRPQYIVLTWENEEGNKCYDKFAGMTSRIIQHEVDHLEGITFLQKANRYYLEQAKKALKKVQRVRKRNEITNN
jgi:peptide deformylase